jgi:Na+/melibiose symporter-like transporter
VPGKGLLRDPDFLKLWSGQAISRIGSSITTIGLPLLALRMLDASPLEMGILASASGVSVLVVGLFAGVWADRIRRRPILIAADLGRAVVVGLVPVAAMLHRLTMAHLYVVAAAGGMLTVLFDVSYQAYLPSLVERENIVEGNSKLAVTESFAEVAGPGFTGILIDLITAPMAMLFDAVSFLCSAVSVLLIRKPEPRPERRPEPRMGREICEGLGAVWRDPMLRALAFRKGSGAFFLGIPGSLYFFFTVHDLGLSASLVGTIISFGGAASLLGAFAVEWLVRRFGFGRTFIGSAVLTGVAMLLVPLAHGSVTLCCAFLAIAQLGDLGWPVYQVNDLSLRQAITPSYLLGRVNAAMHLLFSGIMPLGALTGGAVAQVIGVRTTMLIGAMGFLLSTLWLVFSPIQQLRELPDAVQRSTASGQ